MRAIIVYQSIHHQNTAKIAATLAEKLECRAISVDKIRPQEIIKADLIGFGSGIYFGRFHRVLFALIEKLPVQTGKKAFLFSTSGIPKIPLLYDTHQSFRRVLVRKGFAIIGEFNCPGWDTYPKLVRPFGGIRKKRPNKFDLGKADHFGQCLKSKVDVGDKLG